MEKQLGIVVMCIWHPGTRLLTTAEWEAAGVGLQEQQAHDEEKGNEKDGMIC